MFLGFLCLRGQYFRCSFVLTQFPFQNILMSGHIRFIPRSILAGFAQYYHRHIKWYHSWHPVWSFDKSILWLHVVGAILCDSNSKFRHVIKYGGGRLTVQLHQIKFLEYSRPECVHRDVTKKSNLKPVKIKFPPYREFWISFAFHNSAHCTRRVLVGRSVAIVQLSNRGTALHKNRKGSFHHLFLHGDFTNRESIQWLCRWLEWVVPINGMLV
jgi:hypothetical protein